MNDFGSWMTWTTLSRKLNALNAMNDSRSWMTWTTLGHELKAQNGLDSSRLLGSRPKRRMTTQGYEAIGPKRK